MGNIKSCPQSVLKVEVVWNRRFPCGSLSSKDELYVFKEHDLREIQVC